jgi:hypothetical protein
MVEVIFGGLPMVLMSHQERPNASARLGAAPDSSDRGFNVPE